MTVLVLNAGSSTLKASLVERRAPSPNTSLTEPWIVSNGRPDAARTLDGLLARLDGDLRLVSGVGHRVVHGGDRFRDPVLVDDAVVAELEGLAPLAPLHNPIAIETVGAARRRLPHVPHVACFDTAFHRTLPESAVRYPVPDEWRSWGIRRYGFHGLSVEWSVERAAELLGRPARGLRLVVAHLGAGCSVTAVVRGRSVWTSMGMTPLEGLMMATRAGSIDPGALVRLLRERRLTVDELDTTLEQRSGLVGVGGTADMRILLEHELRGEKRSALAIAMFVDRAAAAIAAAMTRLDRLDAVVFTGGIGEHAASIRARICRSLEVVGVPRIAARKAARDRLLTKPGVEPAILRIEAREDVVIARAVERFGRTKGDQSSAA